MAQDETMSNESRAQLLLKGYEEHCGTSGGKAEAAQTAARLLAAPEEVTTPAQRQLLTRAVEQLTDGRNTVLFSASGLPSVMVRVPAMKLRRLMQVKDENAYHPAFLKGSSVISSYLVAKYQCCMLEGQACSLPLRRPWNGIDFDEAFRACRAVGPRCTLTPFAVWSALALSCRAESKLPHGNNDYGHDYLFGREAGIPAGDGMTLTGSGPEQWGSGFSAFGICDMNGNVNEWAAGLRLKDGEIQLMELERLLEDDCDVSPTSPLWRAVLPDGRLTAPGSEGTLKYDAPKTQIRLTRTITEHGVGNCPFSGICVEDGLAAPELLVALGLYPEESRKGYGLGWRWISTEGEGMPLCGGACKALNHAGVFFVGATYPRTQDYGLTGFRFVCWEG